MIPAIIILVIVVAVVLAIRLFMRRQAEQRQAHDARLRAMAQVYLAAAKKKQAAAAAAPATAAPATTGPPVREERDCPYCAEPILARARVCKHCGRDVEPLK